MLAARGNKMIFKNRATKKRLRKARLAREERPVAQRRGFDIMIKARNLARWSMERIDPDFRGHWYPTRFCAPACMSSAA